MDAVLIVMAIFSILVTVTAVSAAVAGIRKVQITQQARRALPGGHQRAAQMLWQVREVSESPHLRFIADKDVSSTDLAMIKVEETLAALPPGHREFAKMQGEQLAHGRAIRAGVVDNLAHLPNSSTRDLADGVAKGLVHGMSGRELPAGHQHVRRALTTGASDTAAGSARMPVRVDPVHQAMGQVQSWLNQFGGAGRAAPVTTALAQLADMGVVLANDLLSRGRPGGSSPEARRLVDGLEDLGELVTPAYLWQVTDHSETALQNATAALHRLETELAARNRRESFRRYWWPSVGDRIAEDTLAHGRAVLTQEHQAHRRLVAAMENIAVAEPQVRGAVWALMLRDVPAGAIDGPDLRAFTPALDAYLATQRGRR